MSGFPITLGMNPARIPQKPSGPGRAQDHSTGETPLPVRLQDRLNPPIIPIKSTDARIRRSPNLRRTRAVDKGFKGINRNSNNILIII